MIPSGISSWSQGWVSLERIDAFLGEAELKALEGSNAANGRQDEEKDVRGNICQLPLGESSFPSGHHVDGLQLRAAGRCGR